jgi:hypothetical protein
MWISGGTIRTKTAEISSLTLQHGCEGIAAFFEMLLDKVPCVDGALESTALSSRQGGMCEGRVDNGRHSP